MQFSPLPFDPTGAAAAAPTLPQPVVAGGATRDVANAALPAAAFADVLAGIAPPAADQTAALSPGASTSTLPAGLLGDVSNLFDAANPGGGVSPTVAADLPPMPDPTVMAFAAPAAPVPPSAAGAVIGAWLVSGGDDAEAPPSSVDPGNTGDESPRKPDPDAGAGAMSDAIAAPACALPSLIVPPLPATALADEPDDAGVAQIDGSGSRAIRLRPDACHRSAADQPSAGPNALPSKIVPSAPMPAAAGASVDQPTAPNHGMQPGEAGVAASVSEWLPVCRLPNGPADADIPPSNSGTPPANVTATSAALTTNEPPPSLSIADAASALPPIVDRSTPSQAQPAMPQKSFEIASAGEPVAELAIQPSQPPIASPGGELESAPALPGQVQALPASGPAVAIVSSAYLVSPAAVPAAAPTIDRVDVSVPESLASDPALPADPAPGSVPGATSASAWRLAEAPVGPVSESPVRGVVAQEKIAANSPRFTAASTSRRFDGVKTAVRASSKEVVESEPPLGTAIAQPAATMPAGSTLARPNIFHVNAVDLGPVARGDAATVPAQPAPAAGVHQAVEAALNATDRLAHAAQHTVNLRFDIGGNDLTVRVELRGETVHTTFRTDSAELRTALSAEWQAVTGATTADRSGRLATPVFTSNDSGAASASDSGTRHHDQPAHRPEPSLPRFPVPHASGRASANETAAAANPTRTAAVNSLHLHTLA